LPRFNGVKSDSFFDNKSVIKIVKEWIGNEYISNGKDDAKTKLAKIKTINSQIVQLDVQIQQKRDSSKNGNKAMMINDIVKAKDIETNNSNIIDVQA